MVLAGVMEDSGNYAGQVEEKAVRYGTDSADNAVVVA